MWCFWSAFLLVWSALTAAGAAAAPAPAPAQVVAQATTRAPPRTLDRQAAELAWRTWLQSPESGNQNAPPRRITTKSLFITPLVCPKGQRLDTNGCVQVVTVNKDEHERILLEQLNALFTSAPSSDVIYDYGDEQPGPLQLSIPISLDPQAQPLQAQEPSAQAHEQQPAYAKPDKKDDDATAGLVAELELLQLQHSQTLPNDTTSDETADILNHNVLQALDKPKRGATNSTEIESSDNDKGQKEVIYGHVKVDPVLYNTESEIETETQTKVTTTEANTEATATDIPTTTTANSIEVTDNNTSIEITNNTNIEIIDTPHAADNTSHTNKTTTKKINSTDTLKKEGDPIKLNPENDYADIGEAIKLISRYAEVTTDDNFSKDQKKNALKDDSILGTRTKLQYRRNKPKSTEILQEPQSAQGSLELPNEKFPLRFAYPKKDVYYRYPMQGPNLPTPPPDYPFRHIQDYWPGRNQVGGVYSIGHENPRRHHHMFPHNYYRSHGLSDPYGNYPSPHPGLQDSYPAYSGSYQIYPHKATPRHFRPMRSHSTNQDLYTLLGLRHWFSSEGSAKR